MKFIPKLIGLLAVSVVIFYLLIFTGAGIHTMTTMSPFMDDDFLLTTKFSIPLGQIVAYVFFNTVCFFLRRYKLGLMISFAFVFNWGFLHASSNFVDNLGQPTLGLFLYLASRLTIAVLVLMGFIRNEAPEIQSAPTPSADRASPAGRGQESGICPTCHQDLGLISNNIF